MSDKCPVCRTEASGFSTQPIPVGKLCTVECSCPRCGQFILPDDALWVVVDKMLGDDIQTRAKLSHWIRRKHEALAKQPRTPGGHTQPISLDGDLVKSIIKDPRPSLQEQADNLVCWIGDSAKTYAEYVAVDKLAIQAIVGSATSDEFDFVLEYLGDQTLVERKRRVADISVRLSFSGWKRYGEVKRASSDSRKAFMAMQYGEPELDRIVDDFFRPAVKETGFDLSRLDDAEQPAGLIDDRLRVAIRTSRFLIADLSHGNQGAYWEAGFAEGSGKPVIYTCERSVFDDPKRKPHFDTNHHLTIVWDPKEPEKAAKKLKDTIRATLPAEAKLKDE